MVKAKLKRAVGENGDECMSEWKRRSEWTMVSVDGGISKEEASEHGKYHLTEIKLCRHSVNCHIFIDHHLNRAGEGQALPSYQCYAK